MIHTPTRIRLVLAVLFAGAFVMGCAEMLVVGLIDLIADDLSISVPTAGSLVTANALGLAVGGPVLTFLTTRFDRRPVLLAALSVFVVLNLLPAIGAGYPVFVGARVVIGAVQGLYIAAAITTATSIVPPERAGRAMSVVISGFATASALGLPLGTLLGQAIGWRGAFIAVVAIAVVVLVAAVVVVPSATGASDSRVLAQVRFAFAPRVLAVLGLCALIFVAIQSALTYLVPFLTDISNVDAPVVSAYLLAYGVATTVGSAIGGRFADLNARLTLVIGTIGVAASLFTMFLFGSDPIVAGATVVGIGLFGMGMAPSMQHRVAGLAGPGAALAASLPASAVNLGIAAGSFAGGVALGVSGVPAAVLTGAVVAIVAIAAAAATGPLKPAAASTHPATTLTMKRTP